MKRRLTEGQIAMQARTAAITAKFETLKALSRANADAVSQGLAIQPTDPSILGAPKYPEPHPDWIAEILANVQVLYDEIIKDTDLGIMHTKVYRLPSVLIDGREYFEADVYGNYFPRKDFDWPQYHLVFYNATK